jgi:hypothetical protein
MKTISAPAWVLADLTKLSKNRTNLICVSKMHIGFILKIREAIVLLESSPIPQEQCWTTEVESLGN